jgi:uncharacterized protein (DUF2252 family)
MAGERLEFLRGTFYRWAQIWPAVCPTLTTSVRILAVGDLHVASYGTWRDAFGRLVWGIDDFDEAYRMPYASDLVRLATSAVICASDCDLPLSLRDICDVILDGYTEELKSGGQPFVLEESHKWLRTIALKHLDVPAVFWKKIQALPTVKKEIPSGARRALDRMLPQPGIAYRVARRTAGMGSMGHPRFVAIADWNGGKIALEAKAA